MEAEGAGVEALVDEERAEEFGECVVVSLVSKSEEDLVELVVVVSRFRFKVEEESVVAEPFGGLFVESWSAVLTRDAREMVEGRGEDSLRLSVMMESTSVVAEGFNGLGVLVWSDMVENMCRYQNE